MTNSHIFEVINIATGNPVASFLNRSDAYDFVGMRNMMERQVVYRVNPIHIADKPFPATLFR